MDSKEIEIFLTRSTIVGKVDASIWNQTFKTMQNINKKISKINTFENQIVAMWPAKTT